MAKLVIALLLVLAVANAETLSKARLRNSAKATNSEAHYQALKETPFGKNLFNMMSIKFQTTGQLDAILNLLDELHSNIGQQQADDDATYAENAAAFTQRIQDENTNIANAEAAIQDLTERLEADTQERADKTEERDRNVAEAESLRELIVTLGEIRASEHEAYLQRQADEQAILAGLDEVIQLFTAELQNDPNLDRESAEEVLDLLNQIRESVEASLAEDTKIENDAQAYYEGFVAESEARIDELEGEINSLTIRINELTENIEGYTQGIADQHAARENAIEIRDATQQALDEATATHAANSQVRSSQLVLIGQVKVRLTNNSEDVQHFLNNA